ncbi:MAG TPA: 50S ribosomal protein L30 [Clostridiales bacterium]|jgi:large subunit ribosomal protein L30|nr:50S ribosomal protein L30 [Clostridiales bacterium]
MVKITLVRSLIGSKPAQTATAESLGLRKIGDSIVLEDNGATRGKIKVIEHLVRVEKQ